MATSIIVEKPNFHYKKLKRELYAISFLSHFYGEKITTGLVKNYIATLY